MVTTPILVVSSDPSLPRQMRDLIKGKPFAIDLCESIESLDSTLSVRQKGIIIFDLDQMDLDERYFRQLANVPGLCMMGLSNRPFHPDLKEAIGQHLIACLRKPIDPDELIFFLECYAKNGCERNG